MRLLSFVLTWSLKNRAIVVVATLLFVLFGARAAATLPVDAIPDVTNVQVDIITPAPALSPLEVEQYVTAPVERAMSGIPKTTQVRSVSKFGLSVVTIVFRDDTDIYFARQLVSERLHEAQEAIPAGYGKPEMGPITSGLGEVFQFVVKNDRIGAMKTEELLTWTIAPQLRTVPGVIEVSTFGGKARQYQVKLDPARLHAAGISITQVAEALEAANANVGGGYIEKNREHMVIGTDGQLKSLDDIRAVVLGNTPQGVPVTVGSVGDVEIGARLPRGSATKDGKGEVVIGCVLMLMGENSRTVTDALKAKLAALGPTLPEGTRIEPYYDRSALVDRTIHTVGTNLLEAALLVMAVLFLLLGDLRAGIVVAIVIPLSMLFAVVAMKLLGISGNLMSLGATDFGLLVDGSVIIVENAVRRLSEAQATRAEPLTSEERRAVVSKAAFEVRSASVFGELVIAIVYVPILALTGVEGKLFTPMATTVLLALAGAFVLSLTLVPVLTTLVVRPRRGPHGTWLLRRVQSLYIPAFRGALRYRWATVTVGVLAIAAAVGIFTRIGAEFVPQLDEGDLVVQARRLPDISLTESNATSSRIEKDVLDAVPEVTSVVTRTGAPSVATDPMGMEESDIYVNLTDRSTWPKGRTKADIAKDISEVIDREVPEVGSSVTQPIQMRMNELLAGVRSDVAVLVYGSDMEELAKIGDHISDQVKKIPGAVDVRVEQVAGLRYLRVVPDRQRLARYGLSMRDVNDATQSLAVGRPAGEILEGEKRFDLVVRLRDEVTADLDALADIPLRPQSGGIVPLGDVAKIEFVTGPAEISREKQSRRLTVEFNVRGRDMLSVVEEAQRKVGASVSVPVGYRLEWGGQFEHYSDARARLLLVVPLALALIAFLLWLALRSARLAALVFVNVPFAIVGGVVALSVRHMPFSISAGVGFIALFGVAVLNGLVLVSFARTLEAEGVPHGVAIARAAELRLRPVLMTALVASLGFLPMALSTAPGAEVQRPLATVVIGGLLTATLLTMFLLPVLYALVGGRDEPAPAVRREEARV
ncbi:MAG TPA: CusA/CzcA family heavy metal efflux RND transporter [Labilithrix sp.]